MVLSKTAMTCQRPLLQLLHCAVSLILDMHQVSSDYVGYHHIYIPKIKPTLYLLCFRDPIVKRSKLKLLTCL